MATTTNYSWTTPDDTDLVKDGAAAIRTLGSSADTTVKALNPGTTAGDIDYYTTSTAKARIGIGTAGQVLAVNTGATAPEWITSSSGGMTLLSTTTLSGLTTSITSISQDYKNLQIIVAGADAASAFNIEIVVEAGFNNGGITVMRSTTNITADKNDFGNYNSISTGGSNCFVINVNDYTSARYKVGVGHSTYFSGSGDQRVLTVGGWTGATVIDAVTITSSVSLTAGTCLIYGVK